VPRADALDDLGLNAVLETAAFGGMSGLTVGGRARIGREGTR